MIGLWPPISNKSKFKSKVTIYHYQLPGKKSHMHTDKKQNGSFRAFLKIAQNDQRPKIKFSGICYKELL